MQTRFTLSILVCVFIMCACYPDDSLIKSFNSVSQSVSLSGSTSTSSKSWRTPVLIDQSTINSEELNNNVAQGFIIDDSSNEVINIKDIQNGVGAARPENLLEVNGVLFFSADDGATGVELWKSDGTSAGTSQVKDIQNGAASSSPSNFVEMNSILYFTANDGANGVELWRSDGSSNGTYMVKDIHTSGSSSPSSIIVMNNTLYFAATDATYGVELWKSDGTSGGTDLVKDINASGNSSPANLMKVNNVLFFSATDGTNGIELWKSDGTSSGTSIVKNINASGDSSPSNFLAIGSVLYFSATDGANGVELWKSDGTSSGTTILKDINAGVGSSSPLTLTAVGSRIYFSADDGANGVELWSSDGTTAGTAIVKDINGTGNSSPAQFTNINGTLFFSAYDTTNGIEMWKSDGTAGGTTIVTDINAGAGHSNPITYTAIGSRIIFSASDGANGTELWASNGGTSSTAILKDINTTGDSSPGQFKNANGTLFFSADDGVNGAELYKYSPLSCYHPMAVAFDQNENFFTFFNRRSSSDSLSSKVNAYVTQSTDFSIDQWAQSLNDFTQIDVGSAGSSLDSQKFLTLLTAVGDLFSVFFTVEPSTYYQRPLAVRHAAGQSQWSLPVNLRGGSGEKGPIQLNSTALALEKKNDNVIAVWCQGFTGSGSSGIAKAYYNEYQKNIGWRFTNTTDAGTWHDGTNYCGDYGMDLSFDSSGNGFGVYAIEQASPAIRVKQWTANNWVSGTETSIAANNNDTYPRVFIDSSGNASLFFYRGTTLTTLADATNLILATGSYSGGFTATSNFDAAVGAGNVFLKYDSTKEADVLRPVLAYKQDAAAVAFIKSDGVSRRVWVSFYLGSNSWSTPTAVDNGGAGLDVTWADLAINQSSDAVLTYSAIGSDGKEHVYANVFASGSWSGNTQIDTLTSFVAATAPSKLRPSASIDASGHAVVVFSISDSTISGNPRRVVSVSYR